jgi:hypothetical protein
LDTLRRGRQLPGRLEPLGRLLRHPLGDHVVERRQPRIDGRRLRHRRHHVPGDLLLQAVGGIGPRARQALVEHAGQGVHVDARVDLAALEPLRRHVCQRAQRAARRRHPRLARRTRQAEVDQVHEVALGDQDVRRLHITVDQVRLVRGVECTGHLLDDRHHERRVERLVALAQHRAEVAAVDQPHVQVQPPVDLPESVDGHDVRIVHAGGGLRLAAEALLEGDVLGEMGRQHLHRDDAVCPGVEGLVDLAHPAPADQLLQLVVPEWSRFHRSTPQRPIGVSTEPTACLPVR